MNDAAQAAPTTTHLEPKQIFEGGWHVILLAFLGGLLFLWWAMTGAEPGLQFWGCLALGIAAICYPFLVFIRSRKPIMTLTRTGFTIQGMESELPWSAVQDYSIHATGTPLIMNTVSWIYLRPGTIVPRMNNGLGLRIKYIGKKNCLMVRVIQYRGMSAQAFSDLFDEYWRQA